MAAIPVRNRLHVLVSNGKLKLIKELLSQDPDATNLINEPAGVFGYTPLHEAVSIRRADILRLLLTYGGIVDVLSNGRYTPLHIAASIGDVDCIKVLLEFGASISLTDEFGKTPLGTATLNRRGKAARVLRTHEIKKYAKEDNIELRTLIENLKRGKDIEENCFEDALEIAVGKNSGKAVGYLVLHGARNLEKCMQAALLKPSLYRTAVLLLLCYAAKINDNELVRVMCTGLFKGKRDPVSRKNEEILTRNYLPKEWNHILTSHKLTAMREAIRSIDMAFPVAIAFGLAHFEVTRIFLFEIYCKSAEEEADWHGLALNRLLPEWIRGIISFKKLILSYNLLNIFPPEIANMQKLSKLDVSKNSIMEVPKEIFELKYLRSLNLSSNEIQYLPKVDEWSKSLKILNLKENNLRFVDGCMADSELEDLNLSYNELSSVQPCICEVKTLQVLDFSGNKKITVLPPDLAKLTKLNYLGIERMDQITDPPLALRAPTTVLLSHLRARLRKSEPYFTMKLMIVGLVNRGKTTLLHRISRDFAFNKNASTQGVNIKEIKIQNFTFKCWDFAGQEEYYATHQCFLSQRSLYLLVWNVEDGDEGIAGMKLWLDNLQFRVPRSSVIIVGTHLDKINLAEQTEEEIIDKVYELVSKYKGIICQREMIMVTTCSIAKENLEDCKRRTDRLCSLICAVAENMTVDGKQNSQKVMGEMIPSSYLTLAKMVDEKRIELEKEEKLPLLHRCKFQELVDENATKHVHDYFDPGDIDIATEFLHNIGLILHYNDPNQDLRDLYFINPSWLCDLMAKVVTVKEAHNFVRNGILFEKDIPFIIDEKNRRFPKEFYPKYLRLLARFQIACRIDRERVLIPSQLPVNPFENVRIPRKEPHRTLKRIHSFSCIPNGFWSRFISRFLLYLGEMLNTNSECNEKLWKKESLDEENEMKNDAGHATNVEGRWMSGDVFVTDTKRQVDEEVEVQEEITPWDSNGNVDVTDVIIEQQDKDQMSPAVNRIHSSIKDDNDDRKPFVNGNVAAKELVDTGERFSQAANPPFVLNGCLFENEDDRADAHSPRIENLPSRDVTPVSVGGDSSLSSQISASSSQSRAPSAQTCDSDDACCSPPPASTSDDSMAEEHVTTVWQRMAETSSSQPRSGYDETRSEDSEDEFNEPTDIPYLLARQYLVCGRKGVIFNHPLLYLSVTHLPSENGRELIETKVSHSKMGYRALAFTIDHIRTLIKEWFPGLVGTDGYNPYVYQFVPCPICLDFGINPAHRFDVAECFKESVSKDFVVCSNNHTPQVIRIGDLCPDLLFLDLGASMQLNSATLNYSESDSSLLGAGQFGKVYKGTYEGRQAAIKIYNFRVEENPDLHEALDNFCDIRQEAVVLSRTGQHPNVISFLGVAIRPKFCLVIELANQGTLKEVLRSQQINRIVIYRMAQQIASAIAHLHSHGIIHRDLKSDNVLIFSLEADADINVKLADFGTANFISSVGLKFFTGTPGFIAPEIFEYSKTEEYNELVDVYSYAMVLYELLSKRRPFHKVQSALEINAAVKEGKRPVFYDLPDTKVRLLTLTELILKCWVQEPTKRPTSFSVSRQMKSPCFCLLYGKTPLKDVNSPRSLCFVQSTSEIWMACDDRSGTLVLVLDVKNASVKQSILLDNKSLSDAKEPFFNISAIYDIDKNHVAVVLRSTSDYVLIYSSEKKKLVESYQVDNYIRSLAVAENHVIIGWEDGDFTVISKKDFKRGRFKDFLSICVNKRRSITAIITAASEASQGADDAGTRILLGCDKYVYNYPLFSLDPSTVNPETRSATEKKVIYEMHVSDDNRLLFVSHNGSPVISMFMISNMQMVAEINCSEEIRRLLPNSDVFDQRITSFCISGDTLWLGTGSGHILIYEISNGSSPTLITWLKPFKLEVRSLVSCSVPNMEPARLVASIGKEVNMSALCYGDSGLCLLTGSFPVDPSDPSLQRRTPRGAEGKFPINPNATCEFEKRMMLIWDSPGAATLKKIVT